MPRASSRSSRIQVADWTELLASYRRRAARERDKSTKAGLLMEIAALQEQKLMDLDGAAATYHETLETVPGHARVRCGRWRGSRRRAVTGSR